MAHGPSCSAACGIFPDQGSNPCPLNWQADSQPLRHQESPYFFNVMVAINFPLSTAVTASRKFWCVVFLFSFVSKDFLISLVTFFFDLLDF